MVQIQLIHRRPGLT